MPYPLDSRIAYLVTTMAHYAQTGHQNPVLASTLVFAAAMGKTPKWAYDRTNDPERNLGHD